MTEAKFDPATLSRGPYIEANFGEESFEKRLGLYVADLLIRHRKHAETEPVANSNSEPLPTYVEFRLLNTLVDQRGILNLKATADKLVEGRNDSFPSAVFETAVNSFVNELGLEVKYPLDS
jgi:hypothetical protein